MRPSSCHTARKRSHSRASRSTAQSSTSWRMVRRSRSALSIPVLQRHRLPSRALTTSLHCTARRNQMGRLDGRVAIVTGGAKGIGRNYSFALAAEGARVIMADIVDGADVAAEIATKHGANSVASEMCDVSDETAVKRLVAHTMERFGQIDVLVNNAALYAPLHEQKFT